MNTNENYALGGFYLKAKQSGFGFTAAEKDYNGCVQKLKSIIKGLGDKKPTGYQIVISIITIALLFILGGAEASNCQQSLQGWGIFRNYSSIDGVCCGRYCNSIRSLYAHRYKER